MSVNIDDIVRVEVDVSTQTTINTNFNVGLIIGTSEAIREARVKSYDSKAWQTDMVSDGFAVTDQEYVAVTSYFANNKNSKSVLVGAWDTTGSETAVQALDAIIAKNPNFYAFCFCVSVDSVVEDIAKAVEARNNYQFYYTTNSANAITSGGAWSTLKDGGYTRTFGFYSSDNNYLQVSPAVVGLVSSYNTMEVNSSYTLAYKTLTGVASVDLTTSQLSYLKQYNGNAYMKFGNSYDMIYPAVSFGGYHVDEIYMIDASKYLIQQKTLAGLISARKIPQTEDGLDTIVSFISSACDQLADIGFIAGGIWKGGQVGDLASGDAVEGGYYIKAGTIADQTAEERAERVTPPIYVALLSSGALESVQIYVYINR